MQASPRQPHAAALDAHSTAARQRLQAGSADGDVERRVASQRPAYKLAAPVAAMSGKVQAPGAEQTSPGLIICGLKRPRSAAELQGARSPAAAAGAWQLHAEASRTEGVQSPRTPSLAATPKLGLRLRPQSASPRARVSAKSAGELCCRLLGSAHCCISAWSTVASSRGVASFCVLMLCRQRHSKASQPQLGFEWLAGLHSPGRSHHTA